MADNRAMAAPVRVAVVAPCTFPSARGSQVLIRELAHALAARGHDVHVVAYPFAEHLVTVQHIRVHRTRPSRLASMRGLPVLGRKLLLDFGMIRTLRRVVRECGIDVIHAHNYEGPLISYLVRAVSGVPVVYHSHNSMGDELQWHMPHAWLRPLARGVGRFLDRHVPRRADFAIALTPELEGCLLANGVAPQRLCVLPPGAPDFGLEGCTKQKGFPGRFVVMYAGNLDAYQDLAVLGPAFNLFRQHVAHALLVVVTHESGWRRRIPAELRRLCEDGAMQVVVAPSFASVRGWMRQADVLVCPRSSWSGYPIKLLNYLAARRPVVAARSSAKGLADGVHGLLFDNGDARGLADALRALHADESLAERLVWGATQLLGSLPTWNQAAANVEEIYHTLLGTGCPRALSEARDGTYLKGLPVISTNRISALADRVG